MSKYPDILDGFQQAPRFRACLRVLEHMFLQPINLYTHVYMYTYVDILHTHRVYNHKQHNNNCFCKHLRVPELPGSLPEGRPEATMSTLSKHFLNTAQVCMSNPPLTASLIHTRIYHVSYAYIIYIHQLPVHLSRHASPNMLRSRDPRRRCRLLCYMCVYTYIYIYIYKPINKHLYIYIYLYATL